MKNAQQVGTNPNVLAELKILRQRKDELEMRMSALQETRRELMVQLEGLMKLLKVCLFFFFDNMQAQQRLPMHPQKLVILSPASFLQQIPKLGST